MTHDTLVLMVELVALFFFVALGVWRIHETREEKKAAHPRYDMRRDGQRLAA